MMRFVLALLACLIAAPASAQLSGGLMFPGPGMAHSTGGGAVFTFKGQDGGNATTFTSTAVDLGTASADRRVIIAAVAVNGGLTTSSCVVNGVTLAQDVQANPGGNAQTVIYSGIVNTGSGAATISITASAGLIQFLAWTGTGGSSTLVKHTASTGTGNASSMSIAVDAGDFLVVADPFSGNAYSGSTETAVTRTETNSTGHVGSGEWNTIISTNASFSINAGTAWFMAAASYK